MSHDEEHQRKSRIVVETPTERREVVQQTYRTPERERSGFSSGMVAAVALAAIAATAIVFLFVMNRGDDSDTNVSVNARGAAATQPTPYVQQPPVIVQATPLPQMTPIIIQAPPTTAPPVIIQQPAPAAPSTASAQPPSSAGATDDVTMQTRIDKAIRDDSALLSAGLTATVIGGKVTLNGTVGSETLKERAEKLAYAVKGVLSVENQITVVPRTP